MPYPNTLSSFMAELAEDDPQARTPEAEHLMHTMDQLMKSWKENEDRGELFEVLGLDHTQPDADVIEAAFRTLLLAVYPGPSYRALD